MKPGNMKTFDQEIIFIYNAKSNIFSTLSDFAHKMLSPSTYPCSLCQLTYGNIGINKQWALFLKTLPYNKTFLHKDEAIAIEAIYLANLPVILFKNKKGTIQVLMTAQELDQLTSLKDLIETLKSQLDKHVETS